jgi:F-type H+-transporting ATPase subunit gamma
MSGTQELRRRIKSITGTKKVTRAMQLVSASKMRKSTELMLNSAHYQDLLAQLLENSPAARHPLLEEYPNAKETLIVVFSTNKGLVGGFNTNLLKKVLEFSKTLDEKHIKYITLGKKGREGIIRLSRNLLADFQKIDSEPNPEALSPLVGLIAREYQTGKYNKVYLASNKFISSLRQEPTISQIFPLELHNHNRFSRYKFEPNPVELIKHLVPRIVEAKLLSALLQNDAAEHSSRMIMMKNATDSAGDLLADLSLTLNQIRQNKITTELSEITAGKLALEEK